MPRISPEDKKKMICLYQDGMSGAEVAKHLGYKSSNSVRQILKKAGILRTQSAASLLAVKSGKKDLAIEKMVISAKTTNRFNPKKYPWSKDRERHPRWIKDRGLLKSKRMVTEEKDFFKSLIHEAGYRCSLTGLTGTLSVHHIEGVWSHPSLRFDKSNCIVILKKIHLDFHRVYGNRSNSEQWNEYLKSEGYKSLNFEKRRHFVPYYDRIGLRYGRLLVVQKVAGGAIWRCVCECGNYTNVYSSGLSRGTTTSCGCYMKELLSIKAKQTQLWKKSPACVKGTKVNRKIKSNAI